MGEIRKFAKRIKHTLKLGGCAMLRGRLIARRISKDQTTAVRVVDDQRRSSSADQEADGSINYDIVGLGPQGESDTLDACRILIEHLNQCGKNVARPEEPPSDREDIDCIAAVGNRRLEIQVTRLGSQ